MQSTKALGETEAIFRERKYGPMSVRCHW
jgi:hypothetical protein